MKTLATLILTCSALSANAATFNLVGGTAGTLPHNWTDFNGSLSPNKGNAFMKFSASDAASGEGIFLTANSKVTFEYLGKEAGNHNWSSTSTATNFFSNKNTAKGSTYEEVQGMGALDFTFSTDGKYRNKGPGSYTNAVGTSGPGLWLGIFQESDTSAILMFGDGYGDTDYDDMFVRATVAPVPLPAAVWMLGTAIVGFVGIRARARRESEV